MLRRKILYLTYLALFSLSGSIGVTINNCGAAEKTDCAPIASTDLIMTDGPTMANPNLWKHELLDGAWMAPEGNLSLEIHGFDYKFGIYKPGEPDNFRWHSNRFYFDGSQKSTDKATRFDLMLCLNPSIKDTEGNTLVELLEMWHEKRSIFMKVKFPDGVEKIRELRKPESIRE